MEGLAGSLGALEGPMAYAIVQERVDYAAYGDERRAEITGWIEELVHRMLEGGEPVGFRDAARLLHRALALEPEADLGERSLLVRVRGDRSDTAARNLLEKLEPGGTIRSSMRIGSSMTLSWRSGGEGGRVLVELPDARQDREWIVPEKLAYPLFSEQVFTDWIRALPWDTRPHPGGSATSYVATHPEHPGDTLVLTYEDGAAWPGAVLRHVREEVPGGGERFVLTLFAVEIDWGEASSSPRFSEAITFDSLATSNGMFVQHSRLVTRTPEAVLEGGGSLGGPLPVRFTAGTRLQDLRPESTERDRGSDVTTWPPEVLERILGF